MTWRSENFFSSSLVSLRWGQQEVRRLEIANFASGTVGSTVCDRSPSFVLDMLMILHVPLLNLVEALEKWDWNENDDGLLSLTDFDLLCLLSAS